MNNPATSSEYQVIYQHHYVEILMDISLIRNTYATSSGQFSSNINIEREQSYRNAYIHHETSAQPSLLGRYAACR